MRGDCVAYGGPITSHEIEHAFRQMGSVQDFGEHHRADRREFARLYHHRTTGRERRGQFGREYLDRPVPGSDKTTDADRFASDDAVPKERFELVPLEGDDGLLERRECRARLHL